ncbi:MAG: hypothetical protein HeimC2_33450 [Candidatus Heimdallarchaeota archaeon LC_2]|nr:MAG: hypothetical protein HeimC2_33450 [Candidatus Heimdallarchaeota archaeon LC_2]
MFYEFIDQVIDLRNKNESYAIAIVTGHKPPISGKRGDKAIIFEDGRILGWIGGGCTQSVVKQEAKKALKEGKSRVVRITPNKTSEPMFGVIEYNMTCHSGGDIEVYIEPVLPQPQLIIMGKSLVAQTLAKLGKILNYTIIIIATDTHADLFPNADHTYNLLDFNLENLPDASYKFVIVATQGDRDEESLEKILQMESSYIAFVASRKKVTEVFNYLKSTGIEDSVINQIKVPAGIDINAKHPKEVAVSILAEIISKLHSGLDPIINSGIENKTVLDHTNDEKALCPICDMMVDKEISIMIEYKNQKLYFCCKGCEKSFLKEPEAYLIQ